ncbi:MAG: DMT family transporter [Sandaracinus sp.]|nr:DMT family transporter [Sandaracinus sp.]
MDKARGHVAVLLCCLIFATNILVTSSLTEEWMTPMGYTASRLLYGAVALWLIDLFFTKERVARKDLLVLAVGGFLGFVVSQLAFATSVQYTSPVNFSLIMAMVPIVTLVLSVLFLRERTRLANVIGIFLSIAGAVTVVLQRSTDATSGSNDLLGIGIAVVSMSSYAVYLILTRAVTLRYQSITILKWMYLFTALMVLPFGADDLLEQRIYGGEATWSALGQLGFVFVFDTTLVFFLLLFALHRLNATTVSTYLNLLPIFTSVIAIAIGAETPTLTMAVATVLVVGGVLLVTRPVGAPSPVPLEDA